jgi:hypothetical protein
VRKILSVSSRFNENFDEITSEKDFRGGHKDKFGGPRAHIVKLRQELQTMKRRDLR